jgi:hypothetical protein
VTLVRDGSYEVECNPRSARSLAVNGISLPPDFIYSFSLGGGNQPPTIVFQNELAIPQ